MRRSQITAEFSTDIERVWAVVTDNEHYQWRSDLDRIESEGNVFTEYTKEGFQTKFTITEKKPFDQYAFRMENKNFSGTWMGLFQTLPSGGTKIIFTEEISMKNPVMELLSHLFMNLKKMQETYVRDLKKELGES